MALQDAATCPGERPADRLSGAAGAKRGPNGRMQISAELVPIPDTFGCVGMRRDASGCVGILNAGRFR